MAVKTYKREVAVAAAGLFYVFCGFAAAGVEAAFEVCKILVVPTFLALGGAFGLDSVTKQWH